MIFAFLLLALGRVAGAQANAALDDGYQLPKRSVSRLPNAQLNIGLVVKIIDAQTSTTCSRGGGTSYAICVAQPDPVTGIATWVPLSVNLAALASEPTQTIASATSISPTSNMVSISGTTSIQTIALPSGFANGCFDGLATGAWATIAGGNIFGTMTVAANTMYRFCYMADSLWHIK